MEEDIKDRAALLAPGGADRADAAEGIGACLAAERARHLLLDLDHAQVPFRLVIVEGHSEVVEEAQRLVLVGPEAVEEVTHRTLFAPAASSWPDRWGQRILVEPVAEERLLAGDEVITRRALELRGAGKAGVLDSCAHLTQQLLELSRPRLLQFFLHKRQLTQMVGVAQRE